jgi:hypothetical protein
LSIAALVLSFGAELMVEVSRRCFLLEVPPMRVSNAAVVLQVAVTAARRTAATTSTSPLVKDSREAQLPADQ